MRFSATTLALLAHAADPAAKLYYNDYNIESTNAKQKKTLELVQYVQKGGAPIHGVGLQGHFIVDSMPSQADLESVANSFTALGVDVAYTELDVKFTSLPYTKAGLESQATAYASVINACLNVQRCVGWTIWDWTDKYSWVPGTFPGQGGACLYDNNMKPKPAYSAVSAALARATPKTSSAAPVATSAAAPVVSSAVASTSKAAVASSSKAAVASSSKPAVVSPTTQGFNTSIPTTKPSSAPPTTAVLPIVSLTSRPANASTTVRFSNSSSATLPATAKASSTLLPVTKLPVGPGSGPTMPVVGAPSVPAAGVNPAAPSNPAQAPSPIGGKPAAPSNPAQAPAPVGGNPAAPSHPAQAAAPAPTAPAAGGGSGSGSGFPAPPFSSGVVFVSHFFNSSTSAVAATGKPGPTAVPVAPGSDSEAPCRRRRMRARKV